MFIKKKFSKQQNKSAKNVKRNWGLASRLEHPRIAGKQKRK